MFIEYSIYLYTIRSVCVYIIPRERMVHKRRIQHSPRITTTIATPTIIPINCLILRSSVASPSITRISGGKFESEFVVLHVYMCVLLYEYNNNACVCVLLCECVCIVPTIIIIIWWCDALRVSGIFRCSKPILCSN